MTRFLATATFVLFSQLISAETLEAVLARMDQAAAQFHAMSADLIMVQHTAVLDDNTTENGTIKMQKTKSGTEALIDFTGEKDQRTLGFFDKTVQIFFPKLNLVQIYKLGKNSKFLDEYLLLGFGTPGKDLTKAYDVQLVGTEQVAGQSTSKLVLVPKDAGVKQNISKAEIWLPASSGNPIQQKFYQPSGNYRLLTYSNFQLNPSLGSLKLKTPPNAKVQYP
jgi:outer membrane lipoprotein-sorting protein